MRTIKWAFQIAGIIFVGLCPALAADQESFWPSEVSIPNTRQIKFTSAINGEPYTLSISIPFTPPPSNGYPIIYVLDGEAYFPTAANFSVILQRNAAVVVGIGHDALNDKAVALKYSGRKPEDKSPVRVSDMVDAFNNLREIDLTLPLSAANQPPAWYDSTPSGGVDLFLKVLESEIKSKINSLLPIDAHRQALFGHSFGGLAVLHALFTEPEAFQTFISSSPSIWWGGDAILAEEKKLGPSIGKAGPRVLIVSGGDESDKNEFVVPQKLVATLPPDKFAEITPYFKAKAQESGMKSSARDLAARLAELSGAPSYKVEYYVVNDADHSATPFTSIGVGMRFAFAQ